MRVCFVLLALSRCAIAAAVAAQSEEAERARLLAAYEATHAPSTGCSLGEIERRLGRFEDAARHLDAVLEAAETGAVQVERATHSACRFNRARVHEDRGELATAYPLLARALDTPNAERRRTIERRLVAVAARLVQADGCTALASRYSAHALLRFAEEPSLRRCVDAVRRTEPFCARIPASQITGDSEPYGTRQLDADTRVAVDEGFLMLFTRRGARISGIECRLPTRDERLRSARVVTLGSQRLLEVSTLTTVSYACDCDEGDEGDCRCEDYSATTYWLRPNGELLLALVDSDSDRGGMASWGQFAEELMDGAEAVSRAEGDVLVVNGRRLRLVRGVLVPAPEPPAR